jgi:Zn-dependent M28 family amino/carboxypeptidase
MFIKKINPLILLLAVFAFNSCSEKKVEVSKPLYELKTKAVVPAFEAKNAYQYIKEQIKLGPRAPNSMAHAAALNYLTNTLSKFTQTVIKQPFTYTGYNGEKLKFTNVIAKFNPKDKNRILISAHWDSRPRSEQAKDPAKRKLPVLGANDGASGVGVILELARILSENKIDYGVDLVLFDGEDYGKESDLSNFSLGSKYYSSKIINDTYPAFGVLLDMVGDKDAQFSIESNSKDYAPDIVNMFWNKAAQIGADKFTFSTSQPIYDDHIPLNQAGIKTIDIIDSELIGADTPNERRNYWHSDKDTIENIGVETLQQVGDVLINIIYSLKFNYL